MAFTEISFLLFLAVYACLHFSTRGRMHVTVCLAGSYFFYAWWDWRCLFIVMSLTACSYWLALRIDKAGSQRMRRRYLVAAVTLCLVVLAAFKYLDFFIGSFTGLLTLVGLHGNRGTLGIVLPVGISFYTFQILSYVIDVYRRNTPVERSLLNYATYVAFFPEIMAGPILRASVFLPQLRKNHPFEWERFVRGLAMISWGYVMKSVLADSLTAVVDARFLHPEACSSGSLLVGAVFYSFQLYGDFAGYSLIAIGTAQFLGFDFPKNFDRPYFSSSFSEFWKRWHISLSSWIRDYVYISLGGNRKGRFRSYANVLGAMLLCGLWHGATWVFVFWGGLHGVFICIQKLLAPLWKRVDESPIIHLLKNAVMIPLIFVCVTVAWVFFRANSFDTACRILGRIVTQGDFSFASMTQKFEVIKGILVIAAVVCAEALSFSISFREMAERHFWLYGVFIVGCCLTLSLFGVFGSNSFVYFQF